MDKLGVEETFSNMSITIILVAGDFGFLGSGLYEKSSSFWASGFAFGQLLPLPTVEVVIQ